MNVSGSGNPTAPAPSAPARTLNSGSAPNPFAQVTHRQDKKGQSNKGQEWIEERNREKSKLVDGIRNGDNLGKSKGQVERAPRSKSREHVTCHRCLCQGHYASDCTAPAPVPRSASREPPGSADRGGRGASWDRTRGASGDRGGHGGGRPSRDGNRRSTPYGSRDSSKGGVQTGTVTIIWCTSTEQAKTALRTKMRMNGWMR